MPHYSDGSLANLGDMVKGKGYNVSHEIVGLVMAITPHSETCNIQVAHVVKAMMKDGTAYPIIGIEFGQTDAFEKVA